MSRWNGVVRAATVVGATASTSSPASSRPTDRCARTDLIGQRYDDFASDGCLDVLQPPPGWEPARHPGRTVGGVTSTPERAGLGRAITLAELDAEPYGLIATLREREPVAWIPVLDGWLVTRRDLCIEVMRDGERFTVDDPRFSTA